jgi:hypothetical protein
VTGVLNPILAAGAMLLSSLSVIANSQRLSATADFFPGRWAKLPALSGIPNGALASPAAARLRRPGKRFA